MLPPGIPEVYLALKIQTGFWKNSNYQLKKINTLYFDTVAVNYFSRMYLLERHNTQYVLVPNSIFLITCLYWSDKMQSQVSSNTFYWTNGGILTEKLWGYRKPLKVSKGLTLRKGFLQAQKPLCQYFTVCPIKGITQNMLGVFALTLKKIEYYELKMLLYRINLIQVSYLTCLSLYFLI